MTIQQFKNLSEPTHTILPHYKNLETTEDKKVYSNVINDIVFTHTLIKLFDKTGKRRAYRKQFQVCDKGVSKRKFVELLELKSE